MSVSLSQLNSSTTLCEFIPQELLKAEKNGKIKVLYGKSECFDKLKQEAIEKLIQQLVQMRKLFNANDADDTASNFKVILQNAADLRRDIARKTETPDAEDFGFARETLSPFEYLSTPLNAFQYKEINKKIKDLILQSFPKIQNRDRGIRITEGISRYTFRLALDNDLMVAIDALSQSQIDYNRRHELLFNLTFVDNYKTETKPLLNKIRGIAQKNLLYKILPDKNICIYSGRIEIEADNNWRTLTRHYAILGCNDNGEITEENIEDFKKHGFVTLLHTNHEDFKLHESAIAKLFNRIINEKVDNKQLVLAMREFEYRFHHMAYHKRGGQAVPEMVIEAMKTAFCPQYEVKGHLEALAEPFLHRYMQ